MRDREGGGGRGKAGRACLPSGRPHMAPRQSVPRGALRVPSILAGCCISPPSTMQVLLPRTPSITRTRRTRVPSEATGRTLTAARTKGRGAPATRGTQAGETATRLTRPPHALLLASAPIRTADRPCVSRWWADSRGGALWSDVTATTSSGHIGRRRVSGTTTPTRALLPLASADAPCLVARRKKVRNR